MFGKGFNLLSQIRDRHASAIRLGVLPVGVVLLALIARAVVSLNGEIDDIDSPSGADFGQEVNAADRSTAHPDFAQESRQANATERSNSTSIENLLPSGEQSSIPSPQSVANSSRQIDLSVVDNLILHGNYPFAGKLLDEFDQHASGIVKGQVRLRQGLCAELLGDSQQAMAHYRSIMSFHQVTSIADAATIACARLLRERGDREIANTVLMRILLARERFMRADLRGDVVHELAAGLAPSAVPRSMLREENWLVPRRTLTPEELLKRWSCLNEPEPRGNNAPAYSVQQLTQSPRGVNVTLRNETLSITQILKKMASDLNWKLKIPDSRLLERTSVVDCESLPLDVFLDALLQPVGFMWAYRDGQLWIAQQTSSNTPRDYDLHVASRSLKLAVSLAPDHPSAPFSYLMLGEVSAKLGDLAKSVRYFEMTNDLFPHSSAVGAATFNLAKAHLQHGNRELALRHFFKTVDRVSGPEIDVLGYLFAGRVLMENDIAHEAVMPLMRGLSLAEGSDYEPQAALLLSAAYLMSGNANGANTVLVEHRGAFESQNESAFLTEMMLTQLSNQAAFLSSLARFWGSQGNQRIREGRALLSALTRVKPEDMFGGHSAFLVGVGFQSLGLQSERTATFASSLAGPYEFPLQQKMKLLMTGVVSTDDSLGRDAANGRRSNTRSSPEAAAKLSVEAAHRTALANAEAAFHQGRHNDVVQICHELLKEERAGDEGVVPDPDAGTETRRFALRLLGWVYQAQGEHDKAVRCLSGLLPDRQTTSAGAKQFRETRRQ